MEKQYQALITASLALIKAMDEVNEAFSAGLPEFHLQKLEKEVDIKKQELEKLVK
jgi:hypothetical protein